MLLDENRSLQSESRACALRYWVLKHVLVLAGLSALFLLHADEHVGEKVALQLLP